jgi:hypothetical protein
VRLEGTVTEGALVTARAGARKWSRRSVAGGSYLAANDPRVHFGLGEHGVADAVEVQWPEGGRTVLRGVAVDREVVVKE